MTDVTPNPSQQRLIDSTDGTYLVDAGAGTGKTFAITRRYANILETEGVDPDDILLVTFTRNAAGEMAERIADLSPYDPVQIQDAPINTFHGYCFQLLRRYGHAAPEVLGIDDRIPESLDLVEDDVRQTALFRTFIGQFADRHPEYEDLFAAVREPTALRSLIAELASKGVVPTTDGWYRNTASVLSGDREAFFEVFDRANEPNEGAYGPTNSDARASLGGWDTTGYTPDVPSSDELYDGNRIDRAVVERAFDADRDRLVAFVHDVYVEYLEFALQRNYLSHGLMLAMAFVMLCDDATVRESVRHEYVMVDEFQDTNELQFKITLLLAGSNDICVVGDWKQSIYGFQYTSIENILDFEDRIARYRAELNADEPRVPYSVSDVETFPLSRNYRSTESILEFANGTLTIPGTQSEAVSLGRDVEPLQATNEVDNSRLEAYEHEDEVALVLDRLQHVVDNEAYAVETREEPRSTEAMTPADRADAERERLGSPTYGDVAIFTRTRAFARDLIDRATEKGIPVAYEGGIELFDTDQARLLLAWLRICESDARRGWAVVLEDAEYSLPAAREILDAASYPPGMTHFRDQLAETDTVGAFAREVFDRYGYDGAFADGLVSELAAVEEQTLSTRSEAITYVESNLEAGTTVEIDTNPGGESTTLQTIHKAKGLEYPIVLLANVNAGSFPSYGRPDPSTITFDDTLGLRARTMYSEASGRPHVYSNWRRDVLSSCLPTNYDEERRLLYVAVTRAKRHLIVTAGESPSPFFTELPLEADTVDPEVRAVSHREDEPEPLAVEVPDGPGPTRISVHDLLADDVFDDVTGGRGVAFGTRVHEFAEAYAEGETVEPGNADERNVRELLDGLDGDFRVEVEAFLPVETVSGDSATIAGIVDLVHVTANRVDVVDFKTDRSRAAQSEYRKQLSVYYHVIAEAYPDREVTASVFYTADAERVAIEPLTMDAIRALTTRNLD